MQAWVTSMNSDPGGDSSWKDNPYLQIEGGFLAGIPLGAVPLAGPTYNLLGEAKVVDPGTREARRGRGIGEIVGGMFLIASGLTGEIIGTGLTMSGIGSVVGLPAMAVSATLVTAGLASVGFGAREYTQSMSTGSGSGGRTRISSSNWKPRSVTDPRCANGCEDVARQI